MNSSEEQVLLQMTRNMNCSFLRVWAESYPVEWRWAQRKSKQASMDMVHVHTHRVNQTSSTCSFYILYYVWCKCVWWQCWNRNGCVAVLYLYPVYSAFLSVSFSLCARLHCICVGCVLGIRTDEPALFANSWAVDLPHERACPSVDLDFNGPCHSESDMDVRTTEKFCLFSINFCTY